MDLAPPPAHADAGQEFAGHDMNLPERFRLDWAITVLLVCLALLWAWPFLSFSPFNADEGIVLQGAVRVLRGELPYRDFFSFYTPGSYFLYAGLFRVFGTSILAARGALLAYAGLFAALTYLLARRACSRFASAAAAVLVFLVCLPFRFLVLHNWDSTVTAFLCLYCAVWFLQRPRVGWAFAAGLFASATLMIEQSKGAGLLLGLAVGGLLLYRAERTRWRPRHLLMFLLGLVAPVGLVISYFAGRHALPQMLESWTWPLRNYTAVNQVPYGFHTTSLREWRSLASSFPLTERAVILFTLAPMWIIPLLPILLLGMAGGQAFQLLRRATEASPLTKFVTLTGAVLLGVWLATWYTGRPDLNRLVYLSPLFFFAVPLILDPRLAKLPTLQKLRTPLALCIGLSFIAFGLSLSSMPVHATRQVPTRRGVLKTGSTEEVLPYLQAHVPAGAKVLIYPYQAMYSFLSATCSPTRYDVLQVGLNTPQEFQQAMRELERDRTAVVLMDLGFRSSTLPQVWPNTPANVLAGDAMGDFILAHYRPCKTLKSPISTFEYMVRKDLACPAP